MQMLKNSDSMSFEDLGAIYRVEKKSPTLSPVRKDMYPAMAGLVMELRSEYDRCLSTDPESIICEGVNQRRKKAVSMSKEITEMRMNKIATLALIGARGGQNVLDHLTPEERDYYTVVLDVSRKHVELVDKLSGKRRYETPEIDEPPKAERKPAEPVRVKPTETVPEPPAKPIIKEPLRPEPEEETIPEDEAEELPPENYDDVPAAVEEPKPAAEEQKEEPENEEELVVIRILEDLPPFSGPDRNYELTKEDIVRMPRNMAMALVNREKAILISPGP
jgi:DNA replication factor GINS